MQFDPSTEIRHGPPCGMLGHTDVPFLNSIGLGIPYVEREVSANKQRRL